MVRTPHCAQLIDRIKNQWWMDGGLVGRAPRISLLSGAMVVSGSLSVIEALGWPKRMKTTVLYTACLNRITRITDRTQLIQHTEISLECFLGFFVFF